MRFAELIAICVCAFSARLSASYGIEPMGPEIYRKAMSNWNATMAAHQHLELGPYKRTCASDIRASFPACLQYEEDWCWATAVAELAHFYKPEDFPEKGNDCHGVECKIVGYKRDAQNAEACCTATTAKFCPASQTCCRNKFFKNHQCQSKCGLWSTEVEDGQCKKAECSVIGGNTADIVDSIYRLTGKHYANKTDGPLSMEQLDNILSKGHPVVMVVYWGAGGGHAVTLGGCAKAGGPYYLHDPDDPAGVGVYQNLTYEQVGLYVPPYSPKDTGYWMMTFWLDGDLDLNLRAPNDEKIIV